MVHPLLIPVTQLSGPWLAVVTERPRRGAIRPHSVWLFLAAHAHPLSLWRHAAIVTPQSFPKISLCRPAHHAGWRVEVHCGRWEVLGPCGTVPSIVPQPLPRIWKNKMRSKGRHNRLEPRQTLFFRWSPTISPDPGSTDLIAFLEKHIS